MTELDELIARFDPSDPAFIADPYPVLHDLREATPLWHNPTTGQWMITRFQDVYETQRDKRVGNAFTHRFSYEEFGRPEPDPRWPDFDAHERYSLLSLEPPDHTRLRRLVQKVFTPKAVAALRPVLEQFSTELLDRCFEQGEFDLLADYAQPYSVAVICSMLGVPRADTQRLLDWSHTIVKMYEMVPTEEVGRRANQAANEYIEYTRQLIAEKRAEPDGLLLSEFVQVEDQGDRLTEDEIVCTAMVLVEAGHEATVNTLGNGMRAFARHPDQWRRLTAGEVESRSAVEEMIRWDSPLQLFNRWVLEPGFEIGGQQIEVGQQVAMLFGSAERDGRRFERPDEFDIGRNDPAHIGFGGGIHFCVGAPLARQEIDVSILELARRMPEVKLVAEPEYHPTYVIRGLTELRLRA